MSIERATSIKPLLGPKQIDFHFPASAQLDVHLNMSDVEIQMRNKIPPATWDQVKVAQASGIGLREIARKMNLAEGTVLAHAQRNGWTREIEAVKRTTAKKAEITPAEAVVDILSNRKDNSRLHLSKYVVDASRTAANSDGDLGIARQVKDVAAVHSTLWPEQPHQGSYTTPGLAVYAKQAIVSIKPAQNVDAEVTLRGYSLPRFPWRAFRLRT